MKVFPVTWVVRPNGAHAKSYQSVVLVRIYNLRFKRWYARERRGPRCLALHSAQHPSPVPGSRAPPPNVDHFYEVRCRDVETGFQQTLNRTRPRHHTRCALSRVSTLPPRRPSSTTVTNQSRIHERAKSRAIDPSITETEESAVSHQLHYSKAPMSMFLAKLSASPALSAVTLEPVFSESLATSPPHSSKSFFIAARA